MYLLPFYYLPSDFPVFPPYFNQQQALARSPIILPLKTATLNNEFNHLAFTSGANLRISLKQIPPGKTFKSKTSAKTEVFFQMEAGEVMLEYPLSKSKTITKKVKTGMAVIIPPEHSFLLINLASTPAKLYILTVRVTG